MYIYIYIERERERERQYSDFSLNGLKVVLVKHFMNRNEVV